MAVSMYGIAIIEKQSDVGLCNAPAVLISTGALWQAKEQLS
jgi:hypothetical protein